MKITPEELDKNGYVPVETLDHRELVPFVKKYIYRSGYWPWTYFGLTLLILVLTGVLAGNAIYSGHGIILSDVLGKVFAGFALSFLLIPLHEYIHAVAYRICGAKEVSYDADLRKMVFMAIAHRFVAGAREFRFVAIAPFATITLLAVAAIPFLNGINYFTALGIILLHTAFCGGDFAMLSYLEVHKDKEVVTWDDRENRLTFFLSRATPPEAPRKKAGTVFVRPWSDQSSIHSVTADSTACSTSLVSSS